MEAPHRGWSAQQSAQSRNALQEQGQAKDGRPSSNYGPGPQHSPPSTTLPAPGNQYAYQQNSHAMPPLPGINHGSPRQGQSSLSRDGQSQGQGFTLPAISQATGQPSIADRDRAREVEQMHITEEAERHHRELERQRLEQVPQHQAASGPPIHLHQPVAVGTRTVHGPNGLLAQPGIGGPPPSQPGLPLGPPNGLSNGYNGNMMQQNGQQGPGQPGMLMPFAPGAQAIPPAPPQQQQPMAQGQGQQPILNDALSYLDQVKVQFSEHPDVYNRFLDIMKDFKGGVIDTPGVIGRVSQLFAGNPGLIQGFNTFLPPGYRIECGEGDDPNVIRVTTPAGTSLQSIPGTGGRPLSRQDGADTFRRTNGIYTPQPGQVPQMMMSPSGRAIGPVMPNQQYMSAIEHARQQEQQAMHQQEQRGVSHLQNAVSNATAHALRAGMSPVPGRATPLVGGDAMAIDPSAQGGLEKRGPVEFNHAISYVNKIKNRFATQPDIYKQFLEILQTYQRESKPIQDVYSQVTHLFKTAPDLLDDFKQFLPETAAQAKAAMQARQAAEENTMLSNIRGEALYQSPVLSREVGMGTPGHGRGLPPVGNFAPTPNAKDNKRKRGERQGTAIEETFAGSAAAKAQIVGPAGKRMKQSNGAVKILDQPPTSPTLIPALPTALPPTTSSHATNEELSFFDRAKKAISNKNTFNEFLKLCNLFTQDLIDRTTLVHRAKAFIGGHLELMKWFQDFVGYDEREILIENKVRIPGGRVSLSNCRGLGPSYRLLPKRERSKVCSGRDELCRSVLNDEWASHPTWASEDSGFIAHRKNQFEDGLHRIEEERHDYDFNIETCSRTIQLLEPLAQQLHSMSDAEQKSYRLPSGLGGPSESIPRRVIYKCYGRAKGNDVIKQLEGQPWVVIPVLLNRLKERKESWQLAQREWEKVWRDQTQRMFYKSLDHQALNKSTADKRQYTVKVLQAEIATRREELKREEHLRSGSGRAAQLEYNVGDIDVIADAAHFILLFIEQNLTTESPTLATWFTEYITLFFGLDAEWLASALEARKASQSDFDNSEERQLEDEAPASKSRKIGARNKAVQDTIDRAQNDADSRTSTPGQAADSNGEPQDVEMTDLVDRRWMHHGIYTKNGKQTFDPEDAQVRSDFTCWSNTSLYCMMRMFVLLHERLCKIKQAEQACKQTVKSAIIRTAAHDLGLIDREPQDFFSDVSDSANYYQQMLSKFDGVLLARNGADWAEVEETLRRFYMTSGYGLYTFEKIVSATARFAAGFVAPDSRERGIELFNLFKKDRVKDTITSQQRFEYRNQAAARIPKDSEVYRIDWDITTRSVKMWLVKRDDVTFDSFFTPQEQEQKWRDYLATYMSVAPTEGIDYSKLRRPALLRNLRTMGVRADSSDISGAPAGDAESDALLQHRINNSIGSERIEHKITVNGYLTEYLPGTADAWYLTYDERTQGVDGIKEAAEILARRNEYIASLVGNNSPAGLTQEDIEAGNARMADLAT